MPISPTLSEATFLKVEFENFLNILSDRFAGILDDDGEAEFQKQFTNLVDSVEHHYVNVYADPEQVKALHQDIPGIVPYWELIQELRRHDGRLFGALTEDKESTMRAVSKLVSSQETLDFAKNKSSTSVNQVPFEDFDESSSNVKILRVGHFVAYAMSGKGSTLIKKLSTEDISETEKHKKIYDSFKKSVHYAKFNKGNTAVYSQTDRRKSQPGPHITDGLVFNEAGNEAFIVFSTAKADFESQGRQLFDYIKWALDPINKDSETPLKNLDTVTPVFVSFPLISVDSKKPFGGLFKSSDFSGRERELLNSVPFISLLNNVDNFDTPASLDVLMNTSFYTLGGGPSLTWHSRMKELSTIPAPERHKALLKSFAKRIKATATVLHAKATSEKSAYLNEGNLSGSMFNLLTAMSSSIGGIEQHAADFKDDPAFVRELTDIFGNAREQLTAFTEKLNPSRGIQPLQKLQTFKNITETIEPSVFKQRIERCSVAPPPEIVVPPLEWDPIKNALYEYADKVVNPVRDARREAMGSRGGIIDFHNHFWAMLRHKQTHGEYAPFTASKGDLGGTYTPCIAKFMLPEAPQYNNEFPELNKALQPILNILKTNHTTEDILAAIKVELDKQLNPETVQKTVDSTYTDSDILAM